MDINELKNLMRRFNLKPNFTYGQNFLIDDIVLQDIVDAAEVEKDDMVLEIGPGIGNLTELLCQRAAFVLSVEKDPKFYPILRSIKKQHRENFRFEIADALEFDFVKEIIRSGYADRNPDMRITADGLNRQSSADQDVIRKSGSPYKVVANIPYYITGKILQMLMTAKVKPSSITILSQKEVAKNLIAKPGQLSVLAISVQLYGEPKIIQVVPANSFYPAPKVDSAVVRIDLFREPKYKITDEADFFKIVKACFAGKRKQIHNTLVNNLGLEKQSVLKILSDLKIKPASRPQELTIEQWVELRSQIENIKIKKSN